MDAHDRHGIPPFEERRKQHSRRFIGAGGHGDGEKKGRRALLPPPPDLFENLDFHASILSPALFRLVIGDRSRASVSLYRHALARDVEFILKVFLDALGSPFRESLVGLL